MEGRVKVEMLCCVVPPSHRHGLEQIKQESVAVASRECSRIIRLWINKLPVSHATWKNRQPSLGGAILFHLSTTGIRTTSSLVT
jgi:hypothetical protein